MNFVWIFIMIYFGDLLKVEIVMFVKNVIVMNILVYVILIWLFIWLWGMLVEVCVMIVSIILWGVIVSNVSCFIISI